MVDEAAVRAYWDAAAAEFDREPDHGLADPAARAAWAELLARWLPAAPARQVLDAGCGTGTLSLLLARAGHEVTGVDLSPRMVERARRKLADAGHAARFLVGDAAQPPLGEQEFDAVAVRHLVWTLPDPHAALRAWTARLRPGGTLVLVEGRWRQAGDEEPYGAGTGALPWSGGLAATELAAAVAPLVTAWQVEDLSVRPELWGGPVADERYALIARV